MSTSVRSVARVTNPLKALTRYGQSVWLDYIRRSLITTGELKRLIDEDGLRGVTSNPAIFEKAITGSTDYAQTLQELGKKQGLDAKALYEQLAIKDIQDSADVLRPVYEATKRRDGYVSLEVSPYLANKTQETLNEARTLWKAVSRDNVMIKVPATPEGIPAIKQLISEGVNINVTLLFSQDAYEQVALAYIAGLQEFAKKSKDIGKVASVASFFISRIDTLIDSQLADLLKTAKASDQPMIRSLQGKVAIANAKLTYQRYNELFSGPRWNALASRGAQTQRVLWASTSTKNPSYRDVIYVEELIGKDTVDTIPPATYDAFRDHGRPRPSLVEDLEGAQDTMETLARVGVSMKQATDNLLEDGVKIFAEAFDKLLAAVDKHVVKAAPSAVNNLTYTLPSDLAQAVKATLEDWKVNNKVQRLWARDATLWTDTDEANWLGWLGITDDQLSQQPRFKKVASDTAGFSYALLLGMGGSSLCPEVMALTFGKIDGHPEMFVLDSTDPAQIKAIESKIDVGKTIFIVSSKSGGTLEPNIFKQYFFDRATKAVGAGEAGSASSRSPTPGRRCSRWPSTTAFDTFSSAWPVSAAATRPFRISE